MTTTLRRHGALAAVAMFGLLTACSDSTGPDAFNGQAAEDVAASVENVVSTMDAPADAFKSLNLAMNYLGDGGTFDLSVPGQPVPMPSPAAMRDMLGTGPAVYFPSNYLGVTFVYNTTEGHYIPSDRTGGPENGIRVAYYAVDPVTDRPAEPLNELGYIDLTDESTAASERAGILVVSTAGDSETTLADYYLDVSWTETQTSFSVMAAAVGFVSDGTNQLDFDLNQTLSGSQDGGLSMSMDHTLSAGGVSLNFTATAGVNLQTEEISDMEIAVTVNDGTNTAVLDVTIMFADTTETVEGTVSFNGDVVANISGGTEHPTFTRPDGSELTAQEVQGLTRLFDAVGNLFDFIDEIFGAA